ncbi:GNAT family N-acetyltransferase [Pseudonocardia nigra]|uniref:GNAT family N-acetyltransferase n=1 Tax=Pseudonocardia nigra TaxID=1921578 RepID=UPI001C5ED183|nr:GNAT family N-acetyltransferase [Pseudonocardia nigra]
MNPPGVTVRPLPRHEAAHAVDTVFAGLSPRSRYLRFHSPVPRLPTAVRDRLIDLDGRRQAAVLAESAGPGASEPIGIARIIGAGSGGADLAVAVVDAWHRRGVGRRLLTAVTALAEEIGYGELRGMVLPENVAMLSLARQVLPWARPWFDGDAIQFVAPIGEAAWTISEEDVLADLLTR